LTVIAGRLKASPSGSANPVSGAMRTGAVEVVDEAGAVVEVGLTER
jgi:hypothetical protein